MQLWINFEEAHIHNIKKAAIHTKMSDRRDPMDQRWLELGTTGAKMGKGQAAGQRRLVLGFSETHVGIEIQWDQG